jgi:hypothetical protein
MTTTDDRIEALDRERIAAVEMTHLLTRQMQAAYAASVRDGAKVGIEWLANALEGPGNLPLDDRPDPDWYAADKFTRYGEYTPPPWRCRTENEPATQMGTSLPGMEPAR